jgi:hypothetical protein
MELLCVVFGRGDALREVEGDTCVKLRPVSVEGRMQQGKGFGEQTFQVITFG